MDIVKTKLDGVLVIEFNRSEKRNAITAAMYDQLAEMFRDAELDENVRAIVIRGSASIFTAGADISDFLRNPSLAPDSAPCRFLSAISTASKPIIASVSGAAVGVGTTLLLHCDLVYAADTSTFSLPFVQLGLCAEAASSMLLPQLIGYHRAAEMLLLGETLTAAEALRVGLVNRVIPVSKLDEFVRAKAAKLASRPGPSLRLTKGLMKSAQAPAVAQQMMREAEQFSLLLAAPEAIEAFSAFFEKRSPTFN